MAEPHNYVPRVNDPVLFEDSDNRLLVVHVDANRRTAALTTFVGPVIHYENVPWSKLSHCSSSLVVMTCGRKRLKYVL
jgi:hypothetical protein